MSNIQQIDASKVEVSLAATHSESDTSNGLLLDLHEALQTLLSTQDQQDAPDTKAAVLKHLNSIGDRIKEIQKTTHTIPSEGIKIFFYLLAELNNAGHLANLARTNQQDFLIGQAANLRGRKLHGSIGYTGRAIAKSGFSTNTFVRPKYGVHQFVEALVLKAVSRRKIVGFFNLLHDLKVTKNLRFKT